MDSWVCPGLSIHFTVRFFSFLSTSSKWWPNFRLSNDDVSILLPLLSFLVFIFHLSALARVTSNTTVTSTCHVMWPDVRSNYRVKRALHKHIGMFDLCFRSSCKEAQVTRSFLICNCNVITDVINSSALHDCVTDKCNLITVTRYFVTLLLCNSLPSTLPLTYGHRRLGKTKGKRGSPLKGVHLEVFRKKNKLGFSHLPLLIEDIHWLIIWGALQTF